MSNGATVTFENVEKQYGDTKVLLDFNLEVAAGEFVTLLGPSGSGKTTALNALAGFTGISSGDVKVNGSSIIRLPPERRNIGMVFQSYSLFPHMSVFDNVAFPLKLRRCLREETERRVGKVLEMVQLSDLARRMPKELSGGQRQRVAFARAVVFEPSVLLMDEPLSALDLKLRDAMRLEIKRYHSQLGCTILFVTHDQGEALALSDRIAVMGKGQIAQVDTPQIIYDSPASKYVAEFIGQTNILSVEKRANGRWFFSEIGIETASPNWKQAPPRLQISLRPEKLKLSTHEEVGLVSFPVTIEEVLFLGDTIEYSVRADNGFRAMIQAHRGTGVVAATRGSKAHACFSVEDATAI
jgi:putative spermidine/putrescine transport system ATP-binding protein